MLQKRLPDFVKECPAHRGDTSNKSCGLLEMIYPEDPDKVTCPSLKGNHCIMDNDKGDLSAETLIQEIVGKLLGQLFIDCENKDSAVKKLDTFPNIQKKWKEKMLHGLDMHFKD